MLHVLTLEAADRLLRERFSHLRTGGETVPLFDAPGRVTAQALRAREDVPGFTRSTVDGYAVRAADTFGASPTSPALLTLAGEVSMGAAADIALCPGQCAKVPTGGCMPANADAMVMLEDTVSYGAGVIAAEQSTAPGRYLIFAGDDAKAGDTLLPAGKRLTERDVGLLAALGYDRVPVAAKPRVAVLSTGDELVPTGTVPGPGQVRDVNGPQLTAACRQAGAAVDYMGILRDDEDVLEKALKTAVKNADLVILSGGSSAGEKDAVARVLGRLGTVLFHGLAVKPGKPTLAGWIGGAEGRTVPVVGLPGHPGAACFLCRLLVRPLLLAMQGAEEAPVTTAARLSSAIPSNHGREEFVPVQLTGETAKPLMSKSGLMHTLAASDGYVRVPRDAEGLNQNDWVAVIRWEAT